MMPTPTRRRFAPNRWRGLVCAGVAMLASASVLPQANRYSISADGQEVTDTLTQLVWRRCAEGMVARAGNCTATASAYTHEAALNRAKSEALNSGKAWRVPNVKELASIVDRSRVNPAIDVVAFPSTPGGGFWSSSPYAGRAGGAWRVDFGSGYIGFSYRSYATGLRLVRASQ